MSKRILLAVLAVLSLPSAASAEAVSMQAKQANATGLIGAAKPSSIAPLCMIDTGVNVNQDTQDILTARSSFDGGALDGINDHGTWIAHAMAAPSNNWGMTGIFPNAKVLSFRAVGADGLAQGESIAAGITWCQSQGAKVIEIALAGGYSPSTEKAVEAATSADISIVAGAGNKAQTEAAYPARFDKVIGVGAQALDGNNLWSLSARGAGVDVLAPGEGLDVAGTDGVLFKGQGTSFSSALVAASLAAVRSYNPTLTARDAELLLLASARTTAAGPALDVANMFAQAGQAGVLVEPAVEAPVTKPVAKPAPKPVVKPIPQTEQTVPASNRKVSATLVWKKKKLTIKTKNMPSGAMITIKGGKVNLTSDEFKNAPVQRVKKLKVLIKQEGKVLFSKTFKIK